MENKRNRHGRQGHNVTTPQDSLHLGPGERIRLEDVPLSDSNGDNQVGNRAYNDARYQAKSGVARTTRWLTPLVVQWSNAGLVYNHSSAFYEIAGFEGVFFVPAGQKTLVAANPTFGRFDRFAANTAQQVVIIEGEAVPDPPQPELPFPETQIAGPVVFVGAGTTQPEPGTGPGQIQNIVIYNENVSPEWANAYTGPGTANFNNTLFPFTGFKAIDVSNTQNNSTLEFSAATDFDPANFDSLGMQLRLKIAMLTGYNIRARFFNNAGTAISNEVTLPINKPLAGQYQFVGIPMNQFTFTASNARRLRLRWTRGAGAVTYPGFYLDAIQLQGGIIPSEVAGDIILQGQVSASGKTGEPINVALTPTAVSAQTPQTGPLAGTEQILAQIAGGGLIRIAASLLFSSGANGWSPIYALVSDGERRVFQLIDWTGGSGTKPSTGQFIGPSGLVSTASAAVNIRGPQGIDGDDGIPVELQSSGTVIQWRYEGSPTWIDLFDLNDLGPTLPTGGAVGQVLTKTGSEDGAAQWQDPQGGGLELVPFSSQINFAGNFKSYHLQTGPISYTGPTVDALVNFANTTEHYIRANNAGGKPIFNNQYIRMLDNWNNGVDKWNFLKFKMLPSGKIAYWIYDISE